MPRHGMELRHLQEADRHVAETEGRIAHQEALVATLDRDGHDTIEATKLLHVLRDLLEQLTIHRGLILEALAEPEGG